MVYGGTHQNDWETRPSEKDATFIRDGCAKLMAADAKGAEHIRYSTVVLLCYYTYVLVLELLSPSFPL